MTTARSRRTRPRDARRSARSPSGLGSIPWRLIALPVVVVGLAIAIAATRGPAPAPALGQIVPEHTVHEFGTVRMQDGLLVATFPLTVEGAVDAVDLTTS